MVQIQRIIAALAGQAGTAMSGKRQATVTGVDIQDRHIDAVIVAHNSGSDIQRIVEGLELRHKGREVGGRDRAAGCAHPQWHVYQLTAQILER